MIPLSDWLTGRSGPESSPTSGFEVHDLAASETMPDDETCAEITIVKPDPEEILRAALRRTEDQLEELSRAHAERERELMNRLGDELSRHIASEVDRAFDSALGMLEDSLCQALLPFLGEQARVRAVSGLRDLIEQELQQAGSPALEIRAPAELHDALAGLRERSGLLLTVTDCQTIEVVFSTERLRFEELSSRWLAIIQGNE
jgi:hypothetical protein